MLLHPRDLFAAVNAKSVGYASCSTTHQSSDAQVTSLKLAGCAVVFQEIISTSSVGKDRPQLQAALNALVEGDELVVGNWIVWAGISGVS